MISSREGWLKTLVSALTIQKQNSLGCVWVFAYLCTCVFVFLCEWE